MLRKSINFIIAIFRSSAQEYPVAAIIAVFGGVLSLIRGRVSASIVGWSRSSLGVGGKVIGSKNISVGMHASIKRYAWIEAVFSYGAKTFSPSIKIGQNFFASDRLHISAINKIEIGDGCLFGSGVYISDHNHGAYKGTEQSNPLEAPILRNLVSFGPVIIGSNVWLGDNVVIVGPVTIGNGVVIGANSVVTKDIPENIIAAGAPIKELKKFSIENEIWEKHE